ncbi:Hypothetical protein A7982_10443 [Minicystis rosea]|nr:Hypothetical protein A7982_10443 [Minicystis rosea]
MMRKFANETLPPTLSSPAHSPIAPSPIVPALESTPPHWPVSAVERALHTHRMRAENPFAGREHLRPGNAMERAVQAARMRAEPSLARYEPWVGHATAPEVQAKPQAGESAPMVSPASVQQRLGEGESMAPDITARFSHAYGHDLSDVRLHRDSPAATAIGARAVTVGRDVAFAPGEYKPGTPAGDRLIGHELAHVVQQAGGTTAAQGAGLGSEGFEREADQAADIALSGGAVPSLTPVSGHSVQRAPSTLATPLPTKAHDPPAGDAKSGVGPSPEEHARAKAALGQVDRGEVAMKKAQLLSEALPGANEATRTVGRLGAATKKEADSSPHPVASAKPVRVEGPAKGAKASAVRAAEQADRASAIAAPSALSSPIQVVPPRPIAASDAKGTPIATDPGVDARVMELAQQAGELRLQGHNLREHAREEHVNAAILRGNLALVRQGISQAETGIQTSKEHVTVRRQMATDARAALAVSKQKAAAVAAGAPEFAAKAAGGKQKSGPMAQESASLAAKSAARVPDDPEAAEKAREQSGKLGETSAEIGKTDQAIDETRARAASLGEEAAQATAMNARTQGKLEGVDAKLTQTEERLGQMSEHNAAANAAVAALAEQPGALAHRAASLDQHGESLIKASFEIEKRVNDAQRNHEQRAARIPPLRPLLGAPVAQMSPDNRYEDRARVDVAGALPAWLSGVDPLSEHDRFEAEQRERDRREREVGEIEALAGGHFQSASAGQKVAIALRMTGRHLFSAASGIKWPGWGNLALGLINPLGPLRGVVGGLSMILSGGANLLSATQWRRDPLGNLLKSAADIATGLTVILGSITALAGIIIALMTALTIVTVGAAAPVTGPIIAFCSTVLVTVGGWTLSVGAVALVLQGLVLIKNLIEAACATTAAALQTQSDKMTEDVSNAGNVVLQMGMAKLGQVGGRSMQAQVVRAGGGVRWAGGMVPRFGTAARAAGDGARGTFRATSGALRTAYGARGLPGVGVTVARGTGAVARGAGRLARGMWRGMRGETNAGLPIGREGLRRGFLIGEDVAPGWSGLRAAAAQGKQAAQLEPVINALRTSTGEVNRDALQQLMARVPAVEGASEAEIQNLAARTLGVPPESLSLQRVGLAEGEVGQVGASGSPVYLIREGGQVVAVVKAFRMTTEFGEELSSLARLNQELLPGARSARALGAARAGEQGLLVSSVAPGQTIDSIMVAAGRASGEARAALLVRARAACEANGRAIAELHTLPSGSGQSAAGGAVIEQQMRSAASIADDIANRVVQKIDEHLLPPGALDAARLRQRVDELVLGMQRNPGNATLVHGDFHPGNVFYDAEGRITFIDTSRLHGSLNAEGMPIGSPARDFAAFDHKVATFGQTYGLRSDEISSLQAAFRRGYSATGGAGMSMEAEAFFRGRIALGAFLDALKGSKGAMTGKALMDQLDIFKRAMGL